MSTGSVVWSTDPSLQSILLDTRYNRRCHNNRKQLCAGRVELGAATLLERMRRNAIVEILALCLFAVQETIGYPSFGHLRIRRRSPPCAASMSLSFTDASAAVIHHRRPRHVCIVGGGIIGTCTAYYLATRHQIPCTIIDRTGAIASAASGKAGGFLAYDWNDGTPTEELTHRSFRLHRELAEQWTPESIQYRALTCVAVQLLEGQTPAPRHTQHRLEWVHPTNCTSVQRVQAMGSESTIAQVHPKLFCERAWKEAVVAAPACQLRQGKVVETLYSTTPQEKEDVPSVVGVRLEDGTVLDADAVLYACGPWNPPGSTALMQGIKYHSLIVPTRQAYQQCVFFSGSAVVGDLEVYVRPNRTAYCTGYPEAPRVVHDAPGQEPVDANTIATLRQAVAQVTLTTGNDESGFVLDSDQVRGQACYLPSTTDGRPLLGPWPGPARGAYIATGHTCWGILLGPATGECMASLIATGTSPVNLQALRPSRLME
jgi:glycine/D-amino acid oxidase-like deaminating enzyme